MRRRSDLPLPQTFKQALAEGWRYMYHDLDGDPRDPWSGALIMYKGHRKIAIPFHTVEKQVYSFRDAELVLGASSGKKRNWLRRGEKLIQLRRS